MHIVVLNLCDKYDLLKCADWCYGDPDLMGGMKFAGERDESERMYYSFRVRDRCYFAYYLQTAVTELLVVCEGNYMDSSGRKFHFMDAELTRTTEPVRSGREGERGRKDLTFGVGKIVGFRHSILDAIAQMIEIVNVRLLNRLRRILRVQWMSLTRRIMDFMNRHLPSTVPWRYWDPAEVLCSVRLVHETLEWNPTGKTPRAGPTGKEGNLDDRLTVYLSLLIDAMVMAMCDQFAEEVIPDPPPRNH